MAWICNICGAKIKSSQGVFMHNRLAHQMTPEEARRNPLLEVNQCEICGFYTRHSSSYYRHMRNIHNIEPLPQD